MNSKLLAVAAAAAVAAASPAHADQGEIMRWLSGFKTPPKRTFIVHGEPRAQDALQALIRSELGWDCVVPEHGQRFELA